MTETALPPSKGGRLQRVRQLAQRLWAALADLVHTRPRPFLVILDLGPILRWGIAPLLIGWLFSIYLVPAPAVGIIRLNTDIWSGSAELLRLEIAEARADPRIKAVVLELNSPGGEVGATQALYLELLSLREHMPVVTSIDSIAASGGYYLSVATDPVYATPSSIVGNVGVWGFVPPDLGVNEVILASGPFKLTASNRDEFLREIEGIKQEFVAAVRNGRGDRLAISAVELTQGLAYPGREALRLGLIDHVGGQADAIATAAQMAGIATYEVVDLEARALQILRERRPDYFIRPPDWYGAAEPLTGQRTLPPGIYLLYDLRLGASP